MRGLLVAAILGIGALAGGVPLHAQTPKTGIVALGREPDRLYNPTTVSGQLVANLVFDPLVGLDDQMNPYPVLAASIPSPDNSLVRLSGDGADRRLIVTMPLRQDVTWADGEPFTADDVVYTWQLMMNPQSGFDTTVEDKLKNVDKVDDYTAQFTYLSANEARALDPERYKSQGDQPVVDPLYMFGLYDAPAIYPRHKLRELAGDDPRHSRQVGAIETSDFSRNPVGTGPYTLSSWDAGNALTFTSRGLALPQRSSKPGLDTIVFRVMPDKNDSLTALSQGQVQVVAQDALDAGDAPVLDTLAGVRARYTPGNAWEHLTFNLDNPILADPSVRQAIAFGIDRANLNETVLLGKAEVAVSQVPSWSWAFDASLPHYDYNSAQAQQLLDRAGWTRSGADPIRAKGGQRLSLKYWSAPGEFPRSADGAGQGRARADWRRAQCRILSKCDVVRHGGECASSAGQPPVRHRRVRLGEWLRPGLGRPLQHALDQHPVAYQRLPRRQLRRLQEPAQRPVAGPDPGQPRPQLPSHRAPRGANDLAVRPAGPATGSTTRHDSREHSLSQFPSHPRPRRRDMERRTVGPHSRIAMRHRAARFASLAPLRIFTELRK